MIKKIYAFGTSHTAGGGFEYNTDRTNPSIYKKILDSENHFDYSYPSILGRMLDIDVINHAKQGFGYERVNRKILEVISDESFNKDDSLFLIEVSYHDRKEWYIKDLDKYLITNFSPRKIDELSHSTDYHYEDVKTCEIIRDYRNTLVDFYKLTHSDDNYLIKQVQSSFIYMISLLNNLGIRYYLTNGSIPIEPILEHKLDYSNNIVEYKFGDIITSNFVSVQDILIRDESGGIVDDDHKGYSVNLTIAETIYNKLIDDTYLSKDKIEIDFLKNWNKVRNQLFDEN